MDTHESRGQSTELSSQLIRLFTAYPCAGADRADFELILPRDMSDRLYEGIVKQIEFRRKCMNQGFDNLLELLAIHKEAFDKASEAADAKADEEPDKEPVT